VPFACNFFEALISPTLTTQVNTAQAVTALNECTNPNRLAGTADIVTQTLLYPNPANNVLNINSKNTSVFYQSAISKHHRNSQNRIPIIILF
jgi:hypothetical protein